MRASRPVPVIMSDRINRGQRADQRGRAAETSVEAILIQEGWTILGRRMRTPAGEIDMAAEKDGLLAFVEVKARPSLSRAAEALSTRQRTRLVAAADIVLAANPDWGANGVRFDLLVVDAAGVVRRIADAFRGDG